MDTVKTDSLQMGHVLKQVIHFFTHCYHMNDTDHIYTIITGNNLHFELNVKVKHELLWIQV